jgi:hypothetical protein
MMQTAPRRRTATDAILAAARKIRPVDARPNAKCFINARLPGGHFHARRGKIVGM